MARKDKGLKFEAEILADLLRAEIQASLDEAEQIAGEEASKLASAEKAEQSAAKVQDHLGAVLAELDELRAFAQILGKSEALESVLAAVLDEANGMIAAGQAAATALRSDAQALWAGKDDLHAVAQARAELVAKAEANKAEAKLKRSAEALAAVMALVNDQGELEGLLKAYPKRVQEAREGKFAGLRPDDKRGIREEMLRRALRGKGFEPDVVAAVDLSQAEGVFAHEQWLAHDKRQKGDAPEASRDDMEAAEKAFFGLLSELRIPRERISGLEITPNNKGALLINWSAGGRRATERIGQGWEARVQKRLEGLVA